MINHDMTSTVSIDKLLNINSKVFSLEMHWYIEIYNTSLRYMFYVNCQWKIKENNPYNQGFLCINRVLHLYCKHTIILYQT